MVLQQAFIQEADAYRVHAGVRPSDFLSGRGVQDARLDLLSNLDRSYSPAGLGGRRMSARRRERDGHGAAHTQRYPCHPDSFLCRLLITHEETLMMQGRMMVPVNTKEDQESGGRNSAPARIGTHIDR